MTAELTIAGLLAALSGSGIRESAEASAPAADLTEDDYATAEREAIRYEADYPMAPEGDHRTVLAGLLACSGQSGLDDPRLVLLSPGRREAYAARDDGTVVVRRRLPWGGWSAPEVVEMPLSPGCDHE